MYRYSWKGGERIGHGSGFLIDQGIITNAHVVRGKDIDAIAVKFEDSDPSDSGRYIRVVVDDVIAAESGENDRDYAFLRICEPEFADRYRFVFAQGEKVEVGQKVVFLGYPFGMTNLASHVGYISSIHESRGVKTFQIDGSVNGGNSGGPLLSLDTGKVIGIVTRAHTGIVEQQFRELIKALKTNQEVLSRAKSTMSLGGVDPVEGLMVSQAAMERIAVQLHRSANVGIGYAFSSEYIRDHIKK